MDAGLTGKVETSSQRTITLESLLDAQAPKGSFQEHGCNRKASETDVFVLHPVPVSKQPRGQMSRVKEACLELVAILLQQDVNGFFHFVPKRAKKGECPTALCLRGLERLIHTNSIKTLKDLRDRVDELFQSYQRVNVPLGPPSLDGNEA
uniref:V-type proton ATPase subunit E n=1 Tax=Mesocestoides corti TaxID=53468 RepID=A0A5K3FU63_MESCO